MAPQIITWNKVKKEHQTVAGIYAKNEKVISILINTKTGNYPNKIGKDEITYCFGSNTQIWGVRALLKSIERRDIIKVYQKIDVNQWVDLGHWQLKELGEEKDEFWPVKLKKVI